MAAHYAVRSFALEIFEHPDQIRMRIQTRTPHTEKPKSVQCNIPHDRFFLTASSIREPNVTNFQKIICIDIEKNCDCWDGGSGKLTNFSYGFL